MQNKNLTLRRVINNYLKDNQIGVYNLDDVLRLISHTLLKDKNYIHINIDSIKLEEKDIVKCINVLDDYYIKNIPLQYIIGKQHFFNEKYIVNKDVLIPRSDTEILVEKAIEYIRKYNLETMIDMCTGSGCVGISIANNSSIKKALLVDISKDALVVANQNIIQNNIHKDLTVLQSDLFENIKVKVDLIVSNPPYIPTKDIENLSNTVKNEPLIALDGGRDGMDIYNKILNQARKHLTNNAFLMFEIGYDELLKIKELISIYKEYEFLESVKDLGNNDRVVICRFHQI